MAGVYLYDFQTDALGRMKNGCILNGDVGSGKSRTSIAYFYTLYGGKVNTKRYVEMVDPCDLYIITTARKRDTLEWEGELANFRMFPGSDGEYNLYHNKVVIDSWNNIGKYKDVTNSFFIFDEQRVVGYGAWTKSFLQITKSNRWILLSATPGDTWMDYLPVFIANGFFKNKTQFYNEHCIFSRFSKYPKVERYYNEYKLIKLKESILVPMEDRRQTVEHHEDVRCDFNRQQYKDVAARRWNIFKNKPIETAGEYCLVLRQIVNSDISRTNNLVDILSKHPKAIIFYSYNYELDILKYTLEQINYPYSEWNGHEHQPIKGGPRWAYLVEYTAGCEGWNCVETDTIIFYSQNYSYKVMKQAAGRINRMNTPYTDLYYFHFKSSAPIDNAIAYALKRKKKFNEKRFSPVFDTNLNRKQIDNTA